MSLGNPDRPIFIPVELFLPKRAEQTKFHLEWKTDLVYFAVGHLLVQFTAVAVKAPAESVFGGWGLEGTQSTVSSWPFLVQLFMAMLVADLFQYAAHRAFHANRFLWRFHAVHHSIRAVDWLAGSRLHLIDILVTRAFSYIPLYVCEPYRVCRRAFSLRGWSHVTTESVFPRSTRASGAAGPRARG